MYFTATASKSGKIITENLDNKIELQKFGAKMIKRGFVNLDVSAFNSDGFVKRVEYIEQLGIWEKAANYGY